MTKKPNSEPETSYWFSCNAEEYGGEFEGNEHDAVWSFRPAMVSTNVETGQEKYGVRKPRGRPKNSKPRAKDHRGIRISQVPFDYDAGVPVEGTCNTIIQESSEHDEAHKRFLNSLYNAARPSESIRKPVYTENALRERLARISSEIDLGYHISRAVKEGAIITYEQDRERMYVPIVSRILKSIKQE